MTATDELRRMLDERGVEWRNEFAAMCRSNYTHFEPDGGMYVDVWEQDGELGIEAHTDYRFSPAQAIAATLGAGTCHVESSIIDTYEYNRWEYELSCGHAIIWEDSEPPRYCPNCGRRIEQ